MYSLGAGAEATVKATWRTAYLEGCAILHRQSPEPLISLFRMKCVAMDLLIQKLDSVRAEQASPSRDRDGQGKARRLRAIESFLDLHQNTCANRQHRKHPKDSKSHSNSGGFNGSGQTWAVIKRLSRSQFPYDSQEVAN